MDKWDGIIDSDLSFFVSSLSIVFALGIQNFINEIG